MNQDQSAEMSPTERQDIGLKVALSVALGLFILFAGLIAISGWYFRFDFAKQVKMYQKYFLPSENLGPRPGAWTVKDLENYRHQDEALLNSYSWNDVSQTFATVPIDRAMDLAVEKKILKTQKGATDAP